MKRKYPVINIERTGQNIKRIMQLKGLTVKDIQEFLELSTPQTFIIGLMEEICLL